MRKFIISSIVPPTIVALFACLSFYLVNTNIVKKNVNATTSSAIYQLKADVQSILQPNMDKMSNWQSIVEEIHEESALLRVMKGISADLPEGSFFYYATIISRFKKDGFFINNLGWKPEATWEPSSRGWFKEAVANNGKFTYIDPYLDDRTGSVCATFAQSVKSKDGKPLGVAAMDVLLDVLSDLVANTNISPNSNVYILLSDGRYLTNSDASKLINDNYFSGENAENILKAGYNLSEFLDGSEKSFIYNSHFYAVNRIGESPWFVVVDGPVSDFNAQFMRQLMIILCILLVLGVGSAFINMWILNSVRRKEKMLANKLLTETQHLALASKENADTSQNQNVSVKEIVATMEDNNALSESISEKIKDVSGVASKTNEDVAEGVSYLEKNVQQLHEIAQANLNTINGIKSLGDKISNIWDIVSLINSVADQAKIIAFNAELEASSAGEAGRNFHIVATEIRRLADGIIDGTKEIKERITEIQQSSDSLIIASENGTEKINDGVENAAVLSERFESIKNASEITASSSKDITTIIQQQALASEQMLITLKQIATGVENFSSATEDISRASETLKNIAEDLNK
ncbi:methyl-accepting chemotaxis protein [Treponema sp.]|uniref:methyl-accepting chemotaxis protein n=1 Tax=Treponema sp. TaxID=166 RepID=UPI00388F1560